MKRTYLLTGYTLSLVGTFLLVGCSSAKDTLGIGRNTPDEFAIIKRAPLEIPPNLRSLPVPQVGVARPQEDTSEETAQKALFGERTIEKQKVITDTQTTQAEESLLQHAGANETQPNIRNIIDQETEIFATEEQAVIDKILHKKKTIPGSTLDAREEVEKLKEKGISTPNVPPPHQPLPVKK